MELEESHEQLRRQGLGLAAVSYDSPAVLKHFAARRKIQFPLLSDADSTVIRAFGLFNEAVPASSPFRGIPHPATLILDERGVVRSKFLEKDYTVRYTVANILAGRLGIRTRTAESETEAKHVKLKTSASNAVVRPGERIRLFVDAKLPPRMHVYAPGVAGYIAIDWTMEDTPALKALPAEYPRSKRLRLEAIQETVDVFDSDFTMQREIVLSQMKALASLLESSVLTIRGSLKYQACDDRICYTPEVVPLEWKVRVEPHDGQRVPEELRRK